MTEIKVHLGLANITVRLKRFGVLAGPENFWLGRTLISVVLFLGENDEGQLQSLASLKKQTSTVQAVAYMPTKTDPGDEVRILTTRWRLRIRIELLISNALPS